METKKFKINGTELEKGGKKLTKLSILSKVGFTFAGGVAGAAATTAMGKINTMPDEPQETEEGLNEEVQAPVEESQQPSSQHNQVSDENITEPQPIDNNQNNSSHEGLSEATGEEIDPNDVAQAIAEEVDPNDIDSDNILTPDGYDYAYLDDGRQLFCIIAHDPDGNQYILTDIDGDGVFGDIFDINGNLVAQLDEGLSTSDILDMMDDSGEYLAAINEPWEETDPVPVTEEASEDDLVEAEEVDEEDILAQLTEEAEETEESGVYTEPEDNLLAEDEIGDDGDPLTA